MRPGADYSWCGSEIRHPPHNVFIVKKKFAVLRHCGSDRNHCFIIGLPVSKPNWKMEALVCAAERQMADGSRYVSPYDLQYL